MFQGRSARSDARMRDGADEEGFASRVRHIEDHCRRYRWRQILTLVTGRLVMTEPLSATTRPRHRRPAARTIDAAPDRLRGRWPATDQLTEPGTHRTSADRADAYGTAAADVDIAQRARPDIVHVDRGDPARQDVTMERLATFAERMTAINVQMTNPSTGETSVDEPLVTIDAHELNYENDARAQRYVHSASRVR